MFSDRVLESIHRMMAWLNKSLFSPCENQHYGESDSMPPNGYGCMVEHDDPKAS